MAENTDIEELRAPLLAALGAADLALATVNELIGNLRERAEGTRTRVEESRARIARLQEDLPEQSPSCVSASPPRSCARPPQATWRQRPPGKTSWSSGARPRCSVCAASGRSRRPRRVPMATWTRPSS